MVLFFSMGAADARGDAITAYTFSGIPFDDGYSASGSFDINATTSSITNIQITISDPNNLTFSSALGATGYTGNDFGVGTQLVFNNNTGPTGTPSTLNLFLNFFLDLSNPPSTMTLALYPGPAGTTPTYFVDTLLSPSRIEYIGFDVTGGQSIVGSSPVPEPFSVALMLLGLTLLGAMVRLRMLS